MDVGNRRVGVRSSSGSIVAAGSVWESRMKLDEVRGGIKVFNGEETTEEQQQQKQNQNKENGTKLKRNLNNQIGGGSSTAKRKTWKSESFEGFDRNPIQIAREKAEDKRSSDEKVKELSVSVDGIKRSPVHQTRRASIRSEMFERSPVGTRRRKPKSDPVKVSSVEKNKDVNVKEAGSELTSSDEAKDCKEFGVCQEEKVISSNVEVLKSEPKDEVILDDGNDEDNEKEGEEEEEEKIEEEEEEEEEEEVVGDEEIDVEVEKKSIEMIKEIETPIEEDKPNKMIEEIKTPFEEEIKKPNNNLKVVNVNGEKVVREVKKVNFEKREFKNKFHQLHQKQPEPISLNLKKQPPVVKRATMHSSFRTKSPPSSNDYHSFPETQSRLQSFVDLIMWKDISRSVFIFGIGTFTILSSSYTKDLNISFISVMSYLGLVYLAAIFLFRSLAYRGVIDIEQTSYVLGEEEAIWLLRLVLPYLNEFLLKLKALFSGDPATTMKLASLLFVLARCGSSITIWTMAKLGFFGVFTVPKVCSLYSTQITAYAKFWVRRFRDAWDSCSHKKAVTVAVFLLVWNLSSIIARIWAVFMLFVAFRYYQQTIVTDDWVEDGTESEETWYEPNGGQRQGHGSTLVDANTKQKKRS